MTAKATSSFGRLLAELSEIPDRRLPQLRPAALGSAAEVFLGGIPTAKPSGKGPSAYLVNEQAEAKDEARPGQLSLADVERLLHNKLCADDLKALRRRFAQLHHPDRAHIGDRDAAGQDMARANTLIDAALARLLAG